MINTRVWEEKLLIPTYKLLEEDINPILEEGLDPYPYTLQNKISKDLENVEHEVVVVENAYLKLTILPNLGGRVYSAYDKVNNREFLYKNSIIKPRMIGTRGGWISGGMEFNFPISHSPTTMDRVNYSTKTYEDGSASVEFGNIELISGMNWKVELRLYKDKAYIEQKVRLFNPTTQLNRFYFWTNVAVDFDESTKLIYPFDWCINQLEDKYLKWPYNKERDFSELAEVPHAYETFGKLMNENFFGYYSREKQYGLVHYADRKALKGAKFFTWGNDDLGEAWNAALTEDGSKYLEVQSGPFETQMVYKFMKPQEEIKWSEYWYPISNTNGFVHATKELAINFKTLETGIEVSFYATAALADLKVLLKVKGQCLEKTLTFACGRLHKEIFDIGEPINAGEFSLEVYGNKKHILSFGMRDEFIEEELDLELYEDSRVIKGEAYKEKTLDFATFQESVGKTYEARLIYEKQLKEEPKCVITLNRAGNFYFKKGELNKAQECFKRVLNLDNRNSEARFLLASVLKAKGEYKVARRLFQDIACDAEYYKASIIEVIKLNIYFGYYKDAMDILEEREIKHSYYTFLKSIILRKDGLEEASKEILANTFEIDEYILAEKFMLGEEALQEYINMDERTIIQLALEYLELGLREEALKLVDLIKEPNIKVNLIKYRDINSIEDMIPTFINESILVRILEETYAEDSTGKAAYLLGTYYHAMARREEAKQLYLDSYDKGFRYTVLLRNLGLLENNIEYLEEDLKLNNGENIIGIALLYKFYVENKDLEGRKSLIPYLEKGGLYVQLAETLRDIGEFSQAIEILETEDFQNLEGIESSGYCYKDTILAQALKSLDEGDFQKALEIIDKIDKFPKGLNYGNSIRTPLAKEHYYKGKVYAKNKLINKAIEEFRVGALEIDNSELYYNEESRKYSRKCLRELKIRSM